MVLYRLLPHVERYTALDVSRHALDAIRDELTAEERARTTLVQGPAHVLEGMAERSFDTVVINSVAQYFPDADYLAQVLRRASDLVADGGHIFVGDVRSRDHLDAFHTLAALYQASGDVAAPELAKRVEARVPKDAELVLSEAFFHALSREIPRLAGVDVRLKPGRARNEMNAFRYDVVLHVGPCARNPVPLPQAKPDLATLDAVREALATRPPVLVVEGLKNARLAGAYAVRDALTAPNQDAEALRAALDRSEGVDPADLLAIDAEYDVAMVWARSGDGGRFDAVLRHKETGPEGRLTITPPAHALPSGRYANAPAKADLDLATFFDDLRAALRHALPDYMCPAAFVAMEAFPLTPNGKIDRNALPAPRKDTPRTSAAEFLPPSNDLEASLAEIWKGLLNVDRVGLRDNIFDLGANSLLTAQAHQRLSRLLGRKISLVSMFRFPTIETLAAHLGGARAAPAQAEAIEHAPAREDRKKSAAERRRELRGALAR
jgi:hypothetical protein